MDGRRKTKKRVRSICSECERLAEEEARAIAVMDAARSALDGFAPVGPRLSRRDAILQENLEIALFQAQLAHLYTFRRVDDHLKWHGMFG